MFYNLFYQDPPYYHRNTLDTLDLQPLSYTLNCLNYVQVMKVTILLFSQRLCMTRVKIDKQILTSFLCRMRRGDDHIDVAFS